MKPNLEVAMKSMKSASLCASAIVVALCCGACEATVQTRPVEPVDSATVEVTAGTVPVNIETYPYQEYEGRRVYLWGDRWYYRNGNQWGYYRREPETLRRYRATRQAAPPARYEERREERHEDRDRDGRR